MGRHGRMLQFVLSSCLGQTWHFVCSCMAGSDFSDISSKAFVAFKNARVQDLHKSWLMVLVNVCIVWRCVLWWIMYYYIMLLMIDRVLVPSPSPTNSLARPQAALLRWRLSTWSNARETMDGGRPEFCKRTVGGVEVCRWVYAFDDLLFISFLQTCIIVCIWFQLSLC